MVYRAILLLLLRVASPLLLVTWLLSTLMSIGSVGLAEVTAEIGTTEESNIFSEQIPLIASPLVPENRPNLLAQLVIGQESVVHAHRRFRTIVRQ